MIKIGDDYPVWWNTERPKINGYYPAMVLAIRPYNGIFKELFTHILTLSAPSCRSHKTEITVNVNEPFSFYIPKI